MSGSSILKGGEKSELSTQLRKALSVMLGQWKPQRGRCQQQPARNSPVRRAMTHTCPCCSSPSDVGAMPVVWDVSGERTWQSSPLLHNPAVRAQRHAPPRAGSCCRLHGLQNPSAAAVSFLSSFSLTLCSSGITRVTQSAPEQSQYRCKSHPIKKGFLAHRF